MKKYFGQLFVALAMMAGVSALEPYDSIRHLPQTPYFVQDGYVITNLISTHNLAVVIDVESQDGGVARFLAQQAGNLPSLQKIYSVNMWHSNDLSQKHLFQRFLSNVAQENTTEMIIPVRMSSQEAAESFNVKADLVYLVGDNDQQTIYNDIVKWYHHLSDTGVMCGNNWQEPSVQTGVTRAAAMLDVTIQVSGNVWYFVSGS